MTTSPAVIEAYKSGVTIHDLCDNFGITRTEVSLILQGVLRDEDMAGLAFAITDEADERPSPFEQAPHPCTHPGGCTRTVEFDDEPFCFEHSPDEGSSVTGYSFRAEAARTLADVVAEKNDWDSGLVTPRGTDIVTLSMPATLEIDVDLNSGQVVASRCWTPNVATLHGFASSTARPSLDSEVELNNGAREHAAIEIADLAQWPHPELRA